MGWVWFKQGRDVSLKQGQAVVRGSSEDRQTMATPHTREVLRELRKKHGNNVSIVQ